VSSLPLENMSAKVFLRLSSSVRVRASSCMPVSSGPGVRRGEPECKLSEIRCFHFIQHCITFLLPTITTTICFYKASHFIWIFLPTEYWLISNNPINRMWKNSAKYEKSCCIMLSCHGQSCTD
jgi:hypothetical protein